MTDKVADEDSVGGVYVVIQPLLICISVLPGVLW